MSPPNKRAHQLWVRSLDWIKKTGWPTRQQDKAIADSVYSTWVAATNAEWLATGYRDRDALSDALESAFRPVRDERAADSLVILYLFLFEIRGRREGTLRRGRNH